MARERGRKAVVRPAAPRTRLTYYRSAQTAGAGDSPFERRQPKTRGFGRRIIIGVADIFIIGLIIIGLIYALVVNPSPELITNSTIYHSATNYQQVAAALFKKLQNRNKVSLNEQAIISSIQKKFPEVASGSIELPLFSETPKVRLNISPPALLLKSQGSSLIVDQEGVAVAKASGLAINRNLPTVEDQSGFMADLGKQVISSDAISFINTLLLQCRHANVAVASLILPSSAQELDLKTKDQNYFVKFYLGGDPLVQTGQFLAARHQFASTGSQPSEYLDVRVPGKIFYK